MPDGTPWPKFTVVTPSYNQAQFLEETIRSVLLQGYPNLEYIVIDGGSTDGSQIILQKYAPWLTHWVSEADRGQADAITKGLSLAAGELFNFINSDDLLTPGTLYAVASAFPGYDAVAGSCQNFSDSGDLDVMTNVNLTAASMIRHDVDMVFHQPAVWLRRENVMACGGFNTEFDFVFDWDLCIRYLALFRRVKYLSTSLARFRLHEHSKTVKWKSEFTREHDRILSSLQRMSRFAMLHDECSRRQRQLSWWRALSHLEATPGLYGWRKALAVARLACADPAIRWNRLTLGALRQALLQ